MEILLYYNYKGTYDPIYGKEERMMGFFDIFKQRDINQGIEEYKNEAGAVLLDVRKSQ